MLRLERVTLGCNGWREKCAAGRYQRPAGAAQCWLAGTRTSWPSSSGVRTIWQLKRLPGSGGLALASLCLPSWATRWPKVLRCAALTASYPADLAFARQALKRASGYLLGSAVNCPGSCGAVKAMGAVPNPGCLLHFPEDMAIADNIAWVTGRQARSTQRHRFPDGELWWKLPEALPLCMAVWRSPNDPHKKLVELLLVA